MTRQVRTSRVPEWLVLACALALTVLAGCGSSGPGGAGQSTVIQRTGVNWVGDDGLEVRVWTLDVAKHGIGAELYTYEPRPVPAPPQVIAAWSRAGLRVLSVPTVELDGLRQKLPTIGATRQEWLGQQPRWGLLANGPRIAGRLEFVGPDGTDVIERGWARLLLRCWSQTAEDEAGQPITVLRVEVAAQVVAEPSGLTLTPTPWGEGDGRVLESMTLRVRLRDGDALVIVPERPDVSWAALAVPQMDPPIEVAGPSKVAPGESPAFVAPTFGELLLSGDVEFGKSAGTGRVVLALVPHTRTAKQQK